jgi:hypothetical protein
MSGHSSIIHCKFQIPNRRGHFRFQFRVLRIFLTFSCVTHLWRINAFCDVTNLTSKYKYLNNFLNVFQVTTTYCET